MKPEKIYLPKFIVKEIIDILAKIPDKDQDKNRAEYLRTTLILRILKRG